VLLEVKGEKRALCSILYVLLLTAFYHACMGLACIERDITADSNGNITRGIPQVRDVQVSHCKPREAYKTHNHPCSDTVPVQTLIQLT
jgi:hypothetical protein